MKKITGLKVILMLFITIVLIFIDFDILKKKIKFLLKQCISFVYNYFKNRKKGN